MITPLISEIAELLSRSECPFWLDTWFYRRNRDIRGPISEFGWRTEEGLRVVAPEIQLLYKSRSLREKDTDDLSSCLPRLSATQTSNLRAWIALDSGTDHPWVKLLP